MRSSVGKLAVLVVFGHVVLAGAADTGKEGTQAAQDGRACEGVPNEGIRMRELRRELGVYFGQTIPDDLQRRVKKHIDMVARLKAECDRQREQSALAK